MVGAALVVQQALILVIVTVLAMFLPLLVLPLNIPVVVLAVIGVLQKVVG